ncbi:fucolectin-1-like [Haliotis asinina]|uniref:fucolectin-1-like n=1 Tax=Haliotis asinina TaxID=109174 RepID=UPI003531865A
MAKAVVCVLAAALFSVTGVDLPNLALNKPTAQISTLAPHTSGLAVDGNKASDMKNGSCTFTAGSYLPSKQWWQVDLQQIFSVLTVSLTNRGDCCHTRLTNFNVEVHITDPRNGNDTGLQLCYRHEDTVAKGQTVDLTCAVNTIGRYVRIIRQIVFEDNRLTLCEVEVMGAPLRSICGDVSVVFSRHVTGAGKRHNIIAMYENIRKLKCAITCLRTASCKAFHYGSPGMGVVTCEMLAESRDPIGDAFGNVYTINSVQCLTE